MFQVLSNIQVHFRSNKNKPRIATGLTFILYFCFPETAENIYDRDNNDNEHKSPNRIIPPTN